MTEFAIDDLAYVYAGVQPLGGGTKRQKILDVVMDGKPFSIQSDYMRLLKTRMLLAFPELNSIKDKLDVTTHNPEDIIDKLLEIQTSKEGRLPLEGVEEDEDD